MVYILAQVTPKVLFFFFFEQFNIIFIKKIVEKIFDGTFNPVIRIKINNLFKKKTLKSYVSLAYNARLF